MEGNSAASDGGKQAGGRTKTAGISTSTRMQRNQAEKERRDKLNGFISELATLVPMVSNASKPLDKVSILRLAAAEMRLHFSCLNPKKYKSKPLTLPPAVISSLDLIEKTIGGFILVTTLSGLIVFCSRSIEDYLGYQNIDIMGNKVVKYIYEDDIKYFEAKVNSVVKSMKKSSKKKSRVIKAHMLQKPLPRSNECSRPRNMIFKISVHQNDTNESNSSGTSKLTSSIMKKTRSPKDFGYSAVVLMFIEPVRLEPEIDITYIDSNQDVYFTRHGLQGEIIYADQRISTITGYMPHDVQGTSAYQYICSSDVPIALFAQKAMFTSNDGKGVIVYRLRIRDMRFIYLQSSGQIAYKESSSEISHFVCFNRLLSEEEGSQELKRFQQRYAPQIMASKMINVKKGENSQNTDLVLEQALSYIKAAGLCDATSPVSEKSPFQYQKDPSENASSSSNQKSSSDSFVSPSSSSVGTNSSVHTSEGHSITSPMSNGRSSSVGADFSGYVSEQVERPGKRTKITDCSPLTVDPYSTVNNCRNDKTFSPEPCGSNVNVNNSYNHLLVIGKSHHSDTNVKINGSYRTQQSDSSVRTKSQNMHSVNAYSSSQSTIISESPSENTLTGHPVDLIFDHTVLKNTSFTFNTAPSSSYAVQSNSVMPSVDEQQFEYVRCNGQASNSQPANVNHHFLNAPSSLKLSVGHSAALSALRDQQMNFNGHHLSRNGLSHSNDVSSFLGKNPVSSVSSLSNNSLSAASDLGDAVGYSSSVSLYNENSSYSNKYMPSSVSSYSNGANANAMYNDLNILGTKPFSVNPCQTNGFHAPSSFGNMLANFHSVAAFDSMDTSVEMNAINQTPEKILENQIEIVDNSFTTTGNMKPPMAIYHNGSSDTFSSEPLLGPLDWDKTDVISGLPEAIGLAMNKELYHELDLFFQNLPQSHSVGETSVSEELPIASSSYTQNSISSSRANTNYLQ